MTAAPPGDPPGGGGEGSWRRLHPLSPVARLGGVLTAAVVLALSNAGSLRSSRSTGTRTTTWIYLGILALLVLGGVVAWLVTRWRIHQGTLQIDTGLIRRQRFRVPLARIQAIDLVQPLTARLLGLTEVRVVSAGRGLERGRLAYLAAADAAELRARLLALAHGLAEETPEPPPQHLVSIDNGRLAASMLTRGVIVVPFLVQVGILVGVAATSRHGGADAVSGVLLSALLVHALGAARLFSEEFSFTLSEAGDGLRLDRGLLLRRHETIPFGRIQAVRLVEPLVWRALGWCRLEIDVARQHQPRRGEPSSGQQARTLLPIATPPQAAWLLARVMPGAATGSPPGSGPPRRALLKAPLSYHMLASWNDGAHVYARTGRLQRVTVVAPFAKVQSVRLRSGPLLRALRLATVHIDTAGHRWAATARCRDAAEAEHLLGGIAELARAARRRV